MLQSKDSFQHLHALPFQYNINNFLKPLFLAKPDDNLPSELLELHLASYQSMLVLIQPFQPPTFIITKYKYRHPVLSEFHMW